MTRGLGALDRTSALVPGRLRFLLLLLLPAVDAASGLPVQLLEASRHFLGLPLQERLRGVRGVAVLLFFGIFVLAQIRFRLLPPSGLLVL